jgi:hypothetical protein
MRWADHPLTPYLLAGLAFLLAAASALPYAGGFNDGSRLATAESLIERGTFRIDDSLFVRPSDDLASRGMPPYTPKIPDLFAQGTYDKVLIDGHFYSDKPMLPAVLTAAAYRLLMLLGLPAPRERPDVFCRVAAMLTCGIPYAVAVGLMWVMGRRVGLTPGWRTVWLASFALATVLPAYTRQVNAAMPQLGALAVLVVLLSRAAEVVDRTPWLTLAGAGMCAGFAYAVEQPSGALLLLTTSAAVAFRTRRFWPTAVFAFGALPFVVIHHALNYAVGHVWVPMGLLPEYLKWPDSPFGPANMTGFMRHTPGKFVWYAGTLLFGDSGLLVCNLPLFLLPVCGWLVLVRPGPDRIELRALAAWGVAMWLMYAVLSDNFGGGCLSIRWLVPFLVPGFWMLARLLVEWPTFRIDFAILTAWGLVLSVFMWNAGPWPVGGVPYLHAVVVAALGMWIGVRGALIARWVVRRHGGAVTPPPP